LQICGVARKGQLQVLVLLCEKMEGHGGDCVVMARGYYYCSGAGKDGGAQLTMLLQWLMLACTA